MIGAISLAAVAHRLGVDARPRGWQQRHLRWLMAGHGFPPPLPCQSARPSAWRWDSRAVDAWFDARAGNAAVAAADAQAKALAADLLDARASALSCR